MVDGGKSDGYVFKQIADAYYNMFNTTEAIKWYAKATTSAQDAETYYRYAQMLKSNGKYEESNKQMTKFAALAPNDVRAKSFKENPNYVPKLVQGVTYSVAPVKISSDKSDFGAVLYDKTLYFTSARSGSKKTYGWTGEPFLDIYTSIMADSGTFSEPVPLESVNHKRHDGPVTISTDGNTMYFSSDSFREGLFEKDKNNHLIGKLIGYLVTDFVKANFENHQKNQFFRLQKKKFPIRIFNFDSIQSIKTVRFAR